MSLRNFEFLEKIGDGAYSTVWKVKRYSDQAVYALKKVRISKLSDKEKRNALNEVKILSTVNSPYVISYKEAFFDDDSDSLCIVMEFASGGDLYQRVRQGRPLSEDFIWQVIVSIAQGLKSLHDLSIMHRDLKTANVFLFKDSQIKIGDMNVAKVMQDGMLNTQTGTPYYASPEVWRDAPYNTQSDIWSFGCVIYETAALAPPFKAEDMQSLFRLVIKGEYKEIPGNYSDELRSIIGMMLQVNPRHRPSCDQVLRMPVVNRHTSSWKYKTFSNKGYSRDFSEIKEKMSNKTHRSNYRERINFEEVQKGMHRRGFSSDVPAVKLPFIYKPQSFKASIKKPLYPSWWG